jgi:hypothetical protein
VWLLPVTACAAVGGALGAVVLLPGRFVVVGALIALAAATHLRTARRPGTEIKELTAAVVYTAGIWFVPLLSSPEPGAAVWLLAALHLLAAAANLVAFSIFDLPIDRVDDQPSFARTRGVAAARRRLTRLTAVGVLLAVGFLVAGPPRWTLHAAILLVLIGLPALMVRHESVFSRGSRYRTVGDLSFLLMALPWWLG